MASGKVPSANSRICPAPMRADRKISGLRFLFPRKVPQPSAPGPAAQRSRIRPRRFLLTAFGCESGSTASRNGRAHPAASILWLPRRGAAAQRGAAQLILKPPVGGGVVHFSAAGKKVPRPSRSVFSGPAPGTAFACPPASPRSAPFGASPFITRGASAVLCRYSVQFGWTPGGPGWRAFSVPHHRDFTYGSPPTKTPDRFRDLFAMADSEVLKNCTL